MANILYLNHTSSISGAEISLLNCIARLNQDKYSPLLICPPNGPLVSKALSMGVRVETIRLPHLTFTHNPLKLLFFPLSILRTRYHLKPLIRKNNIDLMHANSIRAGILGTLAASSARIPIVWHIRDFLPDNLLARIVRWISGFGAKRIIAISRAIKGEFSVSQEQEEKTVIIYDGVNLQEYDCSMIDVNQTKHALGIAGAFPVVGIIGQIINWKGQKEFIQAAAQIVKTFPEAKLLVIGEALFRKKETIPYKNELIKLVAELGLAEKVIFTGFREDIPGIISTLDIVVLASWKEPLGLAQLEAMAMGKPVVATNAGGTREVVEDGVTGILIPPKNPRAIADAVIGLVKKSDALRDMGKAGHKRVEQNYSLDIHVEKVEHLYKEILCEFRAVEKVEKAKGDVKSEIGNSS